MITSTTFTTIMSVMAMYACTAVYICIAYGDTCIRQTETHESDGNVRSHHPDNGP